MLEAGWVRCWSGHTKPFEVVRWCSGAQSHTPEPTKILLLFWPHQQLLLLQMSNYKRATLEEEDVSDVPVEAASSPDRVEVCTCARTGTD